MQNKKYQEIKKRIEKLRHEKKKPTPIKNANQAFNIAVELVAGVIVGLIIGLLFDKMFDSKPLFLIICLLLSMVAAFRSIWNKYIKNNGT